MSLYLPPVEAPSITVESSVTSTTIPLSWTSAGSVVDSYEVMWIAGPGDCPGVSGGSTTIDGDTTSHTIEGLEEYITYTITVTATNAVGSAVSDQATQRTSEAGKSIFQVLCVNHCSPCVMLLVAPSAAPTSVSVSEVTSSSITVQWGAVDCIHRNGDITGYSVRYGVQGSGSTQTTSVSVNEATISGLTPSTTYSIEVAAVNGAGTGVYSSAVALLTEGILRICKHFIFHLTLCFI